MDKLTIDDVPKIFDYVGKLFADKKDELCQMGAVHG